MKTLSELSISSTTISDFSTMAVTLLVDKVQMFNFAKCSSTSSPQYECFLRVPEGCHSPIQTATAISGLVLM